MIMVFKPVNKDQWPDDYNVYMYDLVDKYNNRCSHALLRQILAAVSSVLSATCKDFMKSEVCSAKLCAYAWKKYDDR